MPSLSLIPVSLEERSTGVNGAGGVVSRMKLTVTGEARLPLESVASRVSVCLPSASGPPLIVAIIDGVRVNVVPLRSPSTLTTGDWSICACNETIGLTVVILPVTVSSEVMLSSAETPVSSARPAVKTGGVRLRPGWFRVMIRVNWLVIPDAFVATTVKVLPPSATGTLKKANRPLGFDCVTAPVCWSVTVRLGLVWPTRVTVASVVVPQPMGRVAELTSRSNVGLAGGAVETGRSWRGSRSRRP